MGAEAGAPPSAARSNTQPASSNLIPPEVQSPLKSVEKLLPTGMSSQTGDEYNTHNLGLRLAADGAAAATAGVLVAPVITMIDKSVVQSYESCKNEKAD